MEHLTKAQIVLLTLFVSFVASMATGIVVVTLMGQAPDPVNQTITNVVERTIEKITPTFVEKPGKTILVKDEDLIVSAVEKNIKSTIALRTTGEDGSILAAGVGTIVSPDGLMITDRGNFGVAERFTTINGVQYSLEIISDNNTNVLGLARLVPVSATTTPTFTAITFGDSGSLKLGQTALVIGGRDGKTISTGLIASIDTHIVADKETKVLDNIGVSTRFAATSNGAPIINLSGEVVGFLSINENIGSQAGVPIDEALRLIEEAKNLPPTKKI